MAELVKLLHGEMVLSWFSSGNGQDGYNNVRVMERGAVASLYLIDVE